MLINIIRDSDVYSDLVIQFIPTVCLLKVFSSAYDYCVIQLWQERILIRHNTDKEASDFTEAEITLYLLYLFYQSFEFK